MGRGVKAPLWVAVAIGWLAMAAGCGNALHRSLGWDGTPWIGGHTCPLGGGYLPPYLPGRVGCVTFAKADVNGDGRLDRILLYGQLGTRRSGTGFVPTAFTLEVLLAGGGKLTARIPHPRENPTIARLGNINGRPGAELIVEEPRLSPLRLDLGRQVVLVYTFNGHNLIRAGTFWYFGNSTQKYGFTCDEQSAASIVQHHFVLRAGRWQRTDKTYGWFGATLRHTATSTTEQHGSPAQILTSDDCRF